MELEQMRQIDAIARTGTMSAAADELHISQPALSRSIQRLEAELGCAFGILHNRTKCRATGYSENRHSICRIKKMPKSAPIGTLFVRKNHSTFACKRISANKSSI